MAEPVDITVGMGTPVRVHVSRRPMSKVQALTESLYQAQKDARVDTRAHLKRAGETFLREQADQRSVASARRAGSAGAGVRSDTVAEPHRVGAQARRLHHDGARARSEIKENAGSRKPFYPPPNKTHTGPGADLSGRPQRSLRQVGTSNEDVLLAATLFTKPTTAVDLILSPSFFSFPSQGCACGFC